MQQLTIFNTLDNQFRGKVQRIGDICCLARVIAGVLPSYRINIQHGIAIAYFDRCYSGVFPDRSTIDIPFKIDGNIARHTLTLHTGRITKIRRLVSEIEMRDRWRDCVDWVAKNKFKSNVVFSLIIYKDLKFETFHINFPFAVL